MIRNQAATGVTNNGVTGYGVFVNTLVYCYLRLLNQNERADNVLHTMKRFTISTAGTKHYLPSGLVLRHKPYFEFWAIKYTTVSASICLAKALQLFEA